MKTVQNGKHFQVRLVSVEVSRKVGDFSDFKKLLNKPFTSIVFSYKDKVICIHHPDAPLIEDYRAGDMICSECGLVVGDR